VVPVVGLRFRLGRKLDGLDDVGVAVVVPAMVVVVLVVVVGLGGGIRKRAGVSVHGWFDCARIPASWLLYLLFKWNR
jgi:hypothetical protein